MKWLLVILVALISFSFIGSDAGRGHVVLMRDTVPTGAAPQLFGSKLYEFKNYVLVDSMIMVMAGDTSGIPRWPAIKYKSSDNRWYGYHGQRYRAFLTGLDTVSLSNRINSNRDTTNEKFLGSIYAQTTWANLNDFNEVGTTNFTVSGGKIVATGGNGNFSQRLDLNIGAHAVTGLQKWKMACIGVMNSKDATSHGFGLGIHSINTGNKFNVAVQFVGNTIALDSGRIVLYSGLDSSIIARSSPLAHSIGDSILLTIEQFDNNLIATGRNLTTHSDSVQAVFDYDFLTGAVMHNTGRFTLHSFGGSFRIDSLSIESNEIKNPNVLITTDSKGVGFSAAYWSESFANLLANRYQSIVNISGGSDMSTEIVQKINEIIAINPRYILLQIPSNDVRNSLPAPTSHANYQRIVDSCHAHGIAILHMLPFYENSVNLSSQVSYIYSTFPTDSIIDTYNPMKLAGAVYIDNVHPSSIGHRLIYDAICSSYKLNGVNVFLPVAGVQNFIPRFTNYSGLGISHISDDNTYFNSSIYQKITNTSPRIYLYKPDAAINKKVWSMQSDDESMSFNIHLDDFSQPGATALKFHRATSGPTASVDYAQFLTSVGINKVPDVGYVFDAIGKARITSSEGNQALTLKLEADHQLEFYNFSGTNYMFMLNAARSASQPLEVRASKITLANYSGTPIAATTTTGSLTVNTATDNSTGAKLQVNGSITTVTDSTGSPKNMAWIDTDGKIRKAAVAAGDGNGIYSGSGSLSGNTTITGAGNTLTLTGTQASAAAFNVNNTGNGEAISAVSTGTGSAFSVANSGSGTGGTISSNTGTAVNATSTSGTLFRGIVNPASTNTEVVTIRTIRQSSGTPAANMGNVWSMDLEDDNSNNITAVQHKAIWTNSTAGATSADYQLWNINAGTFGQKFTVKSTGQVQFNTGYGSVSFSGTPVSSIQSDASGNLINGPLLASGTYTPTLTNGTNVAASTAYSCQYMRIGNTVTVSGKVDIDPTSAAATVLGISLPIASAFANDNEAGGTSSAGIESFAGSIRADATNDRAQMDFVIPVAGSTSNTSWFFSFTYRIL